MEARPSRPARLMPILVVLGLLGVAALSLAPEARAGFYKMVMCAGNTGVVPYSTATNTTSGTNPSGIFEFHNFCGGQGGDPPGENAFLRINENQSSGNAGQGAYGDIIWDTGAFVHWRRTGGYTREAFSFNDGWRARFWAVDYANNGIQLLTQGAGLPNTGTQWGVTLSFGPHLWPFGNDLDLHRFVFELECVRAAGCERAGFNATDANGFVFILSDDSPSQATLANTSSPLLSGQWVRGAQNVSWNSGDLGSGLKVERLRIDGALRWVLDYQAAGACATSTSTVNGEWARNFNPCPTGGPFPRSYALDTSTLADGGHNLSICTQDFGQYQGLSGTGGESCDQRAIRTDNTPPGAPSNLEVTSANSARYLQDFAAHWQLPLNEGSPITRAHYEIVDSEGHVVLPEHTVEGANISSIPEIEGPLQAGDYQLRLWLEDAVGFTGPAATTQIPHDTVAPAAPQDVSVTPPSTSRAADGFDVRWRDIADNGSPIAAVHYEILDGSGSMAVPVQTIRREGAEAIPSLETPQESGGYVLRLWLSDAEGNVGAPARVPLTYSCVRSQASGGTGLMSGLGQQGAGRQVVQEGDGSTLHGALKAHSAGLSGAPLCIFSRVITDENREFMGIALTGSGGSFRFPVSPGASRQLTALYRSDHRELASYSTVETVVHPTLRAENHVVYNKRFARFKGRIPGPDNDRVVIVLQVRQGHGWLAFRRYRTRANGRYTLAYRFRRTYWPTRYIMRAQVRQTVGYPYLQGNSRPLKLLVLPHRPKGH
jgi:hypothetical protein